MSRTNEWIFGEKGVVPIKMIFLSYSVYHFLKQWIFQWDFDPFSSSSFIYLLLLSDNIETANAYSVQNCIETKREIFSRMLRIKERKMRLTKEICADLIQKINQKRRFQCTDLHFIFNASLFNYSSVLSLFTIPHLMFGFGECGK